MTTVFIAGSISIGHLHEKVQERINRIVASGFSVVVGDADGADTAIQQCLCDYRATKVTVYCAGDSPRNNIAGWPVHRVHSNARVGTRAFFTAKDVEMARSSDYGLMVWDCKSTGTLSNVIELLKASKKTLVFVNKSRDFVTIADRSGLDYLLSLMSEHARAKAEEKIGLSAKLAELDQQQFSLDVLADDQLATKPVEHADTFTKSVTQDVVPTESMKLRAELMAALKDYIRRAQLSQSQAAKVLGVTQPRISDLTRGKAELFGLDALVNMAAMAGLRVDMQVRQAA